MGTTLAHLSSILWWIEGLPPASYNGARGHLVNVVNVSLRGKMKDRVREELMLAWHTFSSHTGESIISLYANRNTICKLSQYNYFPPVIFFFFMYKKENRVTEIRVFFGSFFFRLLYFFFHLLYVFQSCRQWVPRQYIYYIILYRLSISRPHHRPSAG